MARIPLVGRGTYESRSVAAECQRTMNWYPEQVESKEGKADVVLYPTPGLILRYTLPDAPVRGEFTEAGLTWAVGGGTLCELGATGAVAVRGTGLSNDGKMATMRSSGVQGHQLFVVSGGFGYILDLNTDVFTPLTTVPGFPSGEALTGTYLDGYFIVSTPTGFQISGLYDGLTWDATDKAIREEGADGIVAGMQAHRELWLWGPVTTEVWYNSGAASFPFAPIPGVFIEMGLYAPASAVRFDNGLAWLSSNRDGDRIAVLCPQYVPQRVSTHAVEVAWRRYARADDAIGWAYQEDGHSFWVLTFPDAGATWVYDAATGLWHERSWWNRNLGVDEAHRGRCHTRAFGQHLVGDRETGAVYELSAAAVDDAGALIRRMRRTPHSAAENQWIFYSRLEVDLETGLAPVTAAVPPAVMLRWSNDRAHTWSPEWWRDAGKTGQYMARVQWERLGRSRDRVFEVTVSDSVPWRLIDGYLTTAGGPQ